MRDVTTDMIESNVVYTKFRPEDPCYVFSCMLADILANRACYGDLLPHHLIFSTLYALLQALQECGAISETDYDPFECETDVESEVLERCIAGFLVEALDCDVSPDGFVQLAQTKEAQKKRKAFRENINIKGC